MRRLGKVPTSWTEEVEVWVNDDDKELYIRVVGARGGIQKEMQLGEYAVSELAALLDRGHGIIGYKGVVHDV